MNTEETPIVPPTPAPTPNTEIPVQVMTDPPATTWVAKEQYSANTAELEKQRVSEIKKSRRIRAFYILLAISGLILFVMYIGMLVWPFEYVSKGQCSGNFFGIAFWLNPLGYLTLLATGIVGATIQRHAARPLGIVLIVAAPVAWFITGTVIVFSFLCGV